MRRDSTWRSLTNCIHPRKLHRCTHARTHTRCHSDTGADVDWISHYPTLADAHSSCTPTDSMDAPTHLQREQPRLVHARKHSATAEARGQPHAPQPPHATQHRATPATACDALQLSPLPAHEQLATPPEEQPLERAAAMVARSSSQLSPLAQQTRLQLRREQLPARLGLQSRRLPQARVPANRVTSRTTEAGGETGSRRVDLRC
jgi:hypothetical protein